MKKDRRKRILILILLFLVLLGVCVPVAYYLVKTREHVKTMQSALDAYENKEYVKAIKLFKKVLHKDADNEMAVTKLAETYCAMGNWPASSSLWMRACRLNNLNKDYERNYVNMSMRSRAFTRVANLYNDPRHKDIDLDEQLVLTYCLLMSQNRKEGIERWKSILKENPQALNMPYGRLINITYFAAEKTFEQAFKELGDLASSEDMNIAQEALIAEANLNKMVRQYANEEEDLKKLTDINFFIGAPLLGEYYSNHLKFVEAIDIFEKYLQKYKHSNIAIVLGELLFFTNQQEKLEKLAKEWKLLAGKNNIMAAYYLESVYALAKKDFPAMATAYQPIHSQNNVNTILAAFISIVVDVHNNDTSKLERDLVRFQNYPPFMDLRTKVHSIVVLYIQDRAKAGVPAKGLIDLADVLLKAKLSDDSSSMLMLVSLIGKLQTGLLTDQDITSTMQLIPNNPTCLEVAVVFNFIRRNLEEAAKYLEQLEKIETNGLSLNMKKIAVDVFAAQGNIDEAVARFMQVLESDKSVDSFSKYFLFCLSNKRKDDIKKLVEMIGDDKELEPVKLFCKSGLELLDGSTNVALDMLEKIDTTDNNLLFFAGRQFAANERKDKAIEKFEKITQNFEKYPQVLMTLSSLYMDKNDNEKAKSFAEKMLQLIPDAIEAKKLLAICYHAEDNWIRALDYCEVSLWENNQDETWQKIWIWATEKKIAYDFDAKRYSSSLHNCNLLLKYDKDNEVATTFLAKIESATETTEQQPEAK